MEIFAAFTRPSVFKVWRSVNKLWFVSVIHLILCSTEEVSRLVVFFYVYNKIRKLDGLYFYLLIVLILPDTIAKLFAGLHGTACPVFFSKFPVL